MRPSVLNPLFTEVTTLKGVGPAAREGLARLLPARYNGLAASNEPTSKDRAPLLRDLVFHLPSGFIDRRYCPPLREAPEGAIITALVKVEAHQPSEGKKAKFSKKPYRVTCSNATGTIEIAFFNPREDYIKQMLPVGEMRLVSGKVEKYDYRLQMTHPDIIALPSERDKVERLDPVYPLTYAMTSRQIGKYIEQALLRVGELPEWIDPHHFKQQEWKSWRQTLVALHNPQSEKDIEPFATERRRFAYDEILANQLALGLVRRRTKKQKTHSIVGSDLLRAKVKAALPFSLTESQINVLGEIARDMASGERMLRLLQGDVGSGKTVVALMAMLKAVEEGRQAALMVPTEILGRQHLAFFQRVLEHTGVRVAMLTGSVKGKLRADMLAVLEAGLVDIIIGTHALFQSDVTFKDLAVVVIDEQHRFGVEQRMALSQKGVHPHVLLMTATPIPRSLTMTAFGDMDCSVLTEKPAGRKPIDTRTVSLSRIEEVVEGVGRAVASGNKVYWICPLVEELTEGDDTEKKDLAAAEARYKEFSVRFGGRVGMVHGRMKGEARDAVMRGFAGDEYDILVATTVVEVGVDVPDATIMIIEHAERFGLAQLHQLRGRVGRGEKPSSCILLYDARTSEVARSRLAIIRQTEDGFLIAEEDMRLRGSGDILGTRQSGLPEFYFANLALHSDLVIAARDDTKLILERDPKLASERGQALRTLLYLYGYDEGIRYLDAG